MCWASSSKPVRNVANEDITVYKILRKYGKRITSPVYKEKVWEIGKVEVFGAIKFFRDGSKLWRINKGFHSLSVRPSINIGFFDTFWILNNVSADGGILFNYEDGECLYECVIPAGSVYYENEHGEVVSDRLIVLKKC